MIDLHSHTNESDGSLTPQQLIELAVTAGLEALAISDHDTFKGYEKALPFAQTAGLDLVQAIELNSRVDDSPKSRYAHILAYFVSTPPEHAFTSWLEEIRQERANRNQKLIASLQAGGVNITLEEVESKGRSLTARPHFARVLVDKGYAVSLEDAFARYLGEDAPSYIHRDSLTTTETVALVRAGGGIPTVAHPIRLAMDKAAERAFLVEAKAAGLIGLEVYHSEHSPELQQYYLGLASELHLLPTGGSDYHGPTVKPDIDLGTGRRGNVNVPLQFLTGLRQFQA